MVCFGNYINFWDEDGNYDIFIIFNEANDDPTIDENGMIEDIIRPVCEDNSIENKKEKIEEVLDSLNLNCLGYGYQVVINK